MPNGAPVGGNEFRRGAKILDFSSKSRVPVRDRQRTERWRRPRLHAGNSHPVCGLASPPTPTKCKKEYFVTFPASAVAREGVRGMGGPPF